MALLSVMTMSLTSCEEDEHYYGNVVGIWELQSDEYGHRCRQICILSRRNRRIRMLQRQRLLDFRHTVSVELRMEWPRQHLHRLRWRQRILLLLRLRRPESGAERRPIFPQLALLSPRSKLMARPGREACAEHTIGCCTGAGQAWRQQPIAISNGGTFSYFLQIPHTTPPDQDATFLSFLARVAVRCLMNIRI